MSDIHIPDENENDRARRLLADLLARFRTESHEELAARINDVPKTEEIWVGDTLYQFELDCFWDSKRGAHVRVMGMLDGGSISPMRPISDSFIMARDGTFVDE